MNTKLLMTASALAMAGGGVLLTFLPQEASELVNPGSAARGAIVFQLMGALYFAFGMVNWTARANLIGGIYSRPVAIGNFSHFMIGGLALLKAYFSSPVSVLLPIMVLYIVFSVAFGYVLFTHPLPATAAQK